LGKNAGEVQRERGIGVEVVPFDEVADRADEDRLDPALRVGKIEMSAGWIDGLVGHGRPPVGGLLSLWL
jgi:hypothetical protein